jgi:acyl-coenzyme A thioesterase PaaI-like protein
MRRIPPRLLRFGLNVWPPFLGARIRVRSIDPDMRRVVVEMPLRRTNRNSFGTQFGGSLFAMTDPFFVLMLIHNLPAGTIIWDKAAAIEFVAPGRGRVHATMAISAEDLDQIERAITAGEKHLHVFKAEIVDDEGLVVARVEKIVYLRRRVAAPPADPPVARAAAVARS